LGNLKFNKYHIIPSKYMNNKEKALIDFEIATNQQLKWALKQTHVFSFYNCYWITLSSLVIYKSTTQMGLRDLEQISCFLVSQVKTPIHWSYWFIIIVRISKSDLMPKLFKLCVQLFKLLNSMHLGSTKP
jgi:hypothetical protein